jgi:UDP-GlcNAc:undecaprenyl-phosphate GlcNAc-1-phosphate transferase
VLELTAYLFLVSLLTVSLLTPLAIRWGRRKGVLSGGWALFGAFTIVLWGHLLAALVVRKLALAEILGGATRSFLEGAPQLLLVPLSLYAGTLAVFLLGLADDLKGISVKRRLVYLGLIATALVATGLRPNLAFLPPWGAGVVGIVWLVVVTNAFNFLDGLDGLSAGVALTATAALLTVTIKTGNQMLVTCLLAMQAGILLGFLRFNFHPARVFLGSSGNLVIGFFVAAATLKVTYMVKSGSNGFLPLLAPLAILAIPFYDTTSMVLARLFRRRHVAIEDQSHFHHRVMRMGFSHAQAVMLIYAIALAVSLSAAQLVGADLKRSVLIVGQNVLLFLILLVLERVISRARK